MQTDLGKIETLTSLLNEARAEADDLRLRLRTYEQTLLSSRLVMGHELKRPATALSGYLELALEEIGAKDSIAAKEAIEKAQHQCRSLDKLNAFFLELLKLGCEPGESGSDQIAVLEFVEGVTAQFPENLNAEKRIKVNVGPNAETVSFNSNAFRTVLTNLIENALIYSDAESLVNVIIERSPDKRGMRETDLLKIRVIDEGVGIPDHSLRRIFKPFVRLEGHAVQGSGLGLTLVKSLVELHDGSIHVRSIEGQGTTVNITVPETPVRNGGSYVS
ncbi:MAG: HAMP domain-containing histidine kinase [Candidatus Latescibacterota bacterium]|nr:MAG: HAMP domain-containing histidine kinase [Candidatus Latescibacterota bacterium]